MKAIKPPMSTVLRPVTCSIARSITRSIAIIVATFLASACSVGPDYQQPNVIEPQRVKYDQGWQPLPQQNWAKNGEWWQVFGDKTLTDLIEQANQSNLTLAQAEARFRQAQAQYRFSRGDFSPVVGLSANSTRNGGSNSRDSKSSSARLDISWELDLWGRIRRQVESDTASLQGRAADFAAARLSIQLSVINSYINVAALDQQRAILQQTLQAYSRSAQLTRNQYEAGIVSRADVIQAETQLQSLRSDLYTLQNQRALEENFLAALLGLAPVAFSIPSIESMPLVPVIPAQVPSQLLARRPDVIAAERSVAAANADIGVAISAWLPTFSISASGRAEGESFSDLWNAPVHFWSMGPSLAQTLFDGGKRRANRDITQARYDESVAVYRQTVLESLRDVENALATNMILSEQSIQQKKLVELAEENEKLITNRYKSGLVSFLEVAAAQNTTLNARRGLVNVRADRLSATAELVAAIGGGWELGDPGVVTNKAYSLK